jgi:hypothetical protein
MLKNKFLSIFLLFKLLKNNKIDERKQKTKKIEDYYSIKQTTKKTDKSLLFSYKEYQNRRSVFFLCTYSLQLFGMERNKYLKNTICLNSNYHK